MFVLEALEAIVYPVRFVNEVVIAKNINPRPVRVYSKGDFIF